MRLLAALVAAMLLAGCGGSSRRAGGVAAGTTAAQRTVTLPDPAQPFNSAALAAVERLKPFSNALSGISARTLRKRAPLLASRRRAYADAVHTLAGRPLPPAPLGAPAARLRSALGRLDRSMAAVARAAGRGDVDAFRKASRGYVHDSRDLADAGKAYEKAGG
jgi:hypothetical protein